MAKPARTFQMSAEDAADAIPPAAEPKTDVPAPATTEAAPALTAKTRPQYREGKRNLSVWLDAKAFNTFKAMVAEDGGTIQQYVVEMINREFARRGRPQIAK
ncbi:UNVERIFIED_CONTAM: hypothetical protein Q9R58_28630 [Methylobacteriaceae bacterium AG10]|nr:hypothetical protein [Methylobacteriaceae bacterium AG10]